MKGDWLNAFKESHNLEFNERDYEQWRTMAAEMLPTFLKHLSRGSTLLECCCGLGCTAIPLSHHFKVTAFDKDDKVLEYARKNAKRFGGTIKVLKADFHDLDKTFSKDSFNACASGGVLEHYPPEVVETLLEKQLSIAPLVFISVPLGSGKKTVDKHGITRYNYTKIQWLDMLKDFKVIQHSTSKIHPKISRNKIIDEFTAVLARKN